MRGDNDGRAGRRRAEKAQGLSLGTVSAERVVPLRDMANATLRWLVWAQLTLQVTQVTQMQVGMKLRGQQVSLSARRSHERVDHGHVRLQVTVTIRRAMSLVVPQPQPRSDLRRN